MNRLLIGKKAILIHLHLALWTKAIKALNSFMNPTLQSDVTDSRTLTVILISLYNLFTKLIII